MVSDVPAVEVERAVVTRAWRWLLFSQLCGLTHRVGLLVCVGGGSETDVQANIRSHSSDFSLYDDVSLKGREVDRILDFVT